MGTSDGQQSCADQPNTAVVHGMVDGEQIDDEALARAAHQDPAAFTELYRRHLPQVYRYLLVRLGDVQQAQDLTSQTFLAALEGIAGYRGRGSFAGWLLTIARHTLIDHFRRARVRATLPLNVVASMPDPAPSPEQVVVARLQLEQIVRVLRVLAPERADAVALRIFSGLSTAETAHVMGKSEASVKMLLSRAIHDLRDRLAFHGEVDL